MKSIKSFLLEKSEEIKNYIKGLSILDNINNKNEDEVKEFVEEFVKPNGPTIYAFITDKVKDAIKIGYTDQHPEKRIEQWKEIYGSEAGEVTCLGWWSSEEFNEAGERVFFWDHAVHKKVSAKGYKQLEKDEFMATLTDKGKQLVDIHFSREFFDKYKRLLNGELDPEDKEELSEKLIEDIIKQMKMNIKKGTADFKLYSFSKEGKTSNQEANKNWPKPDSYSNTDLQEEAIKNGVKAINDGKKNILMAAVMRFGKTHASYEIIKQAGLKKVIVCSAKADVRTAWREDINHVDFYKDFIFIEVLDANNWNTTYYDKDHLVTKHGVPNIKAIEESGKTLIYFFTLHDLGGSIKEIKNKHKDIFDQEFDLMVIDETHYGSHANTFGKVTKLSRDIEEDNSDIEEEQKIAKEAESNLKSLDIKYKCVLQVSGTPYYILASNEMIQDDAEIISKVSYTDMLNARDKWNHDHKDEDPSTSPYFGIPTLHKIGLRLSQKCRKVLKDKGMTDSMTELFKVKGGKFIYENAIEELMKSIFGDGKSKSLAFLKNKSVDGNKVCKHTLIVLPRIEAAQKLKDLLSKIIDTKEREIFCLVSNDGKTRDIKDVDDLNNKLNNLDDEGKKSIILTVNRFLTGVSMPLIDSMIYLKNASSPQEYDQNIFRLCTRNVKSVKNPDNDSRSKKVNMKENVYLIDFNIANMFNMIANSAKMKAAADNNPGIDNIRKYMKEDLAATPIFCEDKGGSEILGKMHKITSKDLMEIYTGYNKNKSISDIVNDDIILFDKLFDDKDFQNTIANLDIEGDNSKNSIDGVNDTDGENIDIDNNQKNKKLHSLSNYIDSKNDKKIIQITKEKFKAITKNLLYCNICLDEPYNDVSTLVKRTHDDKVLKSMLADFGIKVSDIEKIYKAMSNTYKQQYDTLLTRMNLLINDKSMNDYEKFSKAIRGLGRLGKSEVITPSEIVEKMINKLSKEEYNKANSILLVNEKQGEFLYGLKKKFGDDIVKKCKVIPSSMAGKHLTIKLLKSIGIKDYINNIIELEDYDNSGKIDVKDFLKMNEDILKENNGKKFDICLMNPPYGSVGGDVIHLKFVEKCLDISENQIVIFPIGFVTKVNNKVQNKYKEKFSKYLEEVEEVKSTLFSGTMMPNCGIYKFDINKNNNNIKIYRLNQNKQEIKSLLDISNFSNYEKEIIKYLENNGQQIIYWCCGPGARKKEIIGLSEREKNELFEKHFEKNIRNIKEFYNKQNGASLIVNDSNGGMNGTFMSSKVGQIFDNYKDIENFFRNRKPAYNVIMFNNKYEAENCKKALQNPLLRFTCYRMQDDQHMTIKRTYKYIPAIDWEDDRVKTDEGLLEVCGCPKDKCKEYAEYCKKIIKEIDEK